MTPTIQDGDVLCVKPLDRMPKRGEIVLFFLKGEFKAHRVVGTSGNQFITRGDAGKEPDGIVKREEVIGKVIARKCKSSGRINEIGNLERLTFLTSRALGSMAGWLRNWSREILLVLVALGVVAHLELVYGQQNGGVALANANPWEMRP
jgi:signal peptidase I